LIYGRDRSASKNGPRLDEWAFDWDDVVTFMKFDPTVKLDSLIKYGLALVSLMMVFVRLQDRVEADHQTLMDTVKDTHRLALAVASMQAIVDERGHPVQPRRGRQAATESASGGDGE
jgi:hypothetical protein